MPSSRSGKQTASDTVFLSGLDVSSKSIVTQIKTAMPKVLLVTDADATLQQARDEVAAGARPNPYEGMLNTTGTTLSERWAKKSPLLQQCVDIYEKASGKTVPGPEEETTDSAGKKVQTDVAISDFCGELFMFRAIAERVGRDLTVNSWQKAVNGYRSIDLVLWRLEEGHSHQGRQRRAVHEARRRGLTTPARCCVGSLARRCRGTTR